MVDKKNINVEKVVIPQVGEPVSNAAPVAPVQSVGVRKMNTAALLSFIFSLTFFIPLHWLVGIITGHIALKQLKADPNQDGDWAAKSGLIISYVFFGLTVLAVLFIIGVSLLGVMFASLL